MTAIIDYGVGNLFSLKSSLSFIGEDTVVSGEENVIKSADRIILPGVGAFAKAAEKLSENGLSELVIDQAREGKPLLGICLGMQLLFGRSFEYGETEGLGLIEGEVLPIEGIIPKGYKIPHIGWNALSFTGKGKSSPIFKYVAEGEYVYFVHSYAAMKCGESLLASAGYGAPLTAAAGGGNIFGTQFHPEKSGEVGLRILKAFCEI